MNTELVELDEQIEQNNKAIDAVQLTIKLVKTSSASYDLFEKITNTISILESLDTYLNQIKLQLAEKLKN